MAKTITFAIVHFSVAFTVGYLLTGSIAIGGAIALIEPACNTVAYYFHERIWRRIEHKNSKNPPIDDGTAGHHALIDIHPSLK